MPNPFASMSRRFLPVLFCLSLGLPGQFAKMVLADETPTATPAVPATQPTTQPALVLSPDTRELLDSISAAYKKLNSLDLSGSIDRDIQVGERNSKGSQPFTSSFLAPDFFRHEISGKLLCGSTGKSLFSYLASRRIFTQTDAPAGRVNSDALPSPLPSVLDPGLELAIANDPAAECAQHATSLSRGPDTTIDAKPCPTLHLVRDNREVATLMFDPQTLLLRREVLDAAAILKAEGLKNVISASMTFDYTTVRPNADLKPESFAWTPPEGARDAATAQKEMAMGPRAPLAMTGKPAPAMSLPGLDGKTISLSDLKGSVVVLDFWATWCPPCRASLPHLDELYNANKAAGLKVFAVNLKEDKDDVTAFVNSTKLSVPVLLDSDGKTAEAFLVSGIPQTVVIGKDGTVKKVFIGFDPDETPKQLADAIHAALTQ